MVNCQLPPLDPMTCAGNFSENWKAFKEVFNNFATATQLTAKNEPIQAATLKMVMGRKCQQIHSRLELTEADKKMPGKNSRESRGVFHKFSRK